MIGEPTKLTRPAGKAKKAADGGWREALKTIAYAVAIALVVRTFFYQPFNIPSGSMKATLLVGDYLFASKFAYGYGRYAFPFGLIPFKGRFFGAEPQRGDVVIFKLPRDNATDYIKRLIGLPGDTWREIRGNVYINGKKLTEPYVKPDRRDTLSQGPIKIPKGQYFMMGDNRNGSCDSRRWGTVPRHNLIGKVIATYWPPSRISIQ